MILKILEDKENKLLNRKEVLVEIEFSGKTPSNNEVKKELVKHFKTDEKLVIIEKIDQEFGLNKGKVHAKIYKSEKDVEKIEFIEEAKEKQEGKVEEKPTEQKSEEKKEEKKPEEKPKEEPKKEEVKEEKPKEEESGETKQKEEERKEEGKEERKEQETK